MAEDDQLIAGRYRLAERVGSGAMGVVWRAEDERLRRTVALKQVRLPGAVDDHGRDRAHRRVMREGRLFARLHHPNAIAVFDVVDHEAEPWLVMEYLPSQSLAEVVAARGVLTPLAAASVGHQIAAALTAAHTAGIVHRDVKPGNVLLGADGVVKVTDFGVSRAIDEATVTTSGMVAGTPAYLAPEVARGAEADFRSDVYSLGSTIYAAVEGQPPFGQGDNTLAQLHRVATGDYTPPRRAGSLTPLLERLLDDDPARRPEMHQVRDELGRLAAVEAETEEVAEERPGPASAPEEGDGGVRSGIVPLAAAAARTPTATGAPPPEGSAGPVAVDAAPAPPPPTTPDTTLPVVTGLAGGTATGPGEEHLPVPDDEGPRRRRGPLVAAGVGVALVGAAVVLALVLATTSSTGGGTVAAPAPTTTASRPDTGQDTGTDGGSGDGVASAGPAAPAPGTPDQVAEQQAIIDYYGLIPTDLAEGWQRLTPGYQRNTAGGFAGYARFWGAIRSTSVRGVSPGPGDTVDATVTYVDDGGRTSQERTLFRMVQQGGSWKIDGSQVLSSR